MYELIDDIDLSRVTGGIVSNFTIDGNRTLYRGNGHEMVADIPNDGSKACTSAIGKMHNAMANASKHGRFMRWLLSSFNRVDSAAIRAVSACHGGSFQGSKY